MIRLSFMSKLIKTGKQRPLIEEDLGHVSSNMKMDYLYGKLEYEWKKECQKDVSKRSFVKSMIRATGIGNWVLAIFLNVVSIIISIVPTIILNLMVSDLEQDEPSIILIILFICRLYFTLDLYCCSSSSSLY